MLIKYFIPEDGDDQSHPNVFELNIGSNRKPTLVDIRSVSIEYTHNRICISYDDLI